MSVIRVGSNAKYADGWSLVFAKGKAGAAKRSTAAAKKGAKTATKKKAKKRGG